MGMSLAVAGAVDMSLELCGGLGALGEEAGGEVVCAAGAGGVEGG